jgi:MoxR-like ATPase
MNQQQQQQGRNNTMNHQTTTEALPKCWQAVADLMGSGIDRLLLFGPSGTGKTYYGLTSAPQGVPAYRLICSEEMTTSQIEGAFYPSSEGFEYREGVAVRAWREGARLVIDEVSRANGDVMSLLLAFTDTTASSSWEHPVTHEKVAPSASFSVVLTMNGEPRDLDPALLDRFTARVRIDEVHPQAIAELPDYLRGIATVLGREDSPESRASVRAFQTVAQVAERHGIKRALEIVLPDHAEAILDTITLSDAQTGGN